MQKRRVFITGNSSGLGYGLTAHYVEQGATIFGMSRRGCRGLGDEINDVRCDLADLEAIPEAMDRLLGEADGLDIVILNAGVISPVELMSDTEMEAIYRVMDINLWSNKIILDWLTAWDKPVKQIVAISSGAAVNGNKGWGPYSVSKAALNMLTKLYAGEHPGPHYTALAPGLVDTAMQDYLCEQVDADDYPSVNKLRNARGTENMPSPREAAKKIAGVIDRLPGMSESGAFLDVRKI